MTNFQSDKSAKSLNWLSPERALFFLPLLASVGIAVAVILLALLPMWRLMQERQEVVDDLLIKTAALPELQKDLVEQQRVRSELQAQETRLLNVISGTKDLDTLLGELNQMAIRRQVVVATTEPGEIETWIPALDEQEASGSDTPGLSADQSAASDALLQEGLEKRMASLAIRGEFRQVLAFLQDLESLEVFVITSGLNIEAKTSSSSGDAQLLDTELELQLTAYGRSPQRENDADMTPLDEGVQP